jgi:hypothetical protein
MKRRQTPTKIFQKFEFNFVIHFKDCTKIPWENNILYFLRCLWVKQGYEIEISLSVGAIIVAKPKYPAAYMLRICCAKRFALVPYLIISPHGALRIQSNWNLFRACIPL